MGDSEDEYQSHNTGNLGHNGNNSMGNGGGHNNSFNNKKNTNRDKFYRERDDSANTGYNNNSRNNNDSRRDWSNDRGNRGNNDSYKNNRMGNQSSYGYGHQGGGGGMGGAGGYQRMSHSDYPKKYSHQSPNAGDSSPPPYKRNRRDYDDSGSRSHGDSMYSSPSGGGYNSSSHQKSQRDSDYPTQPPFLSFKLFLAQQDDNISDEDAIKRYNDYKMDFKKNQINNFFLEHKEEEWFKMRYHPDENFKRRNEHNKFILNRLEVFLDLMDHGWLENKSVESDKAKDIIKFLDAAVIKLEGGTDDDLKILDGNMEVKKAEDEEVKEITEEEEKPKVENEGEEVKEEVKTEPEEEKAATDENEDPNKKNGKAKKRRAEDSGSESGAYSESDNDEAGGESRKKKSSRKVSESKTSKTGSHNDLHKTCSIFMRNLGPSVTKTDLENLCKDYEGFKRVAISDPAPERGFFRRGWITFDSNVDVKKICWNLQNVKIKDFNPGAIVNRELTNRIRPIPNLVSHHKSVIKNDIKLAMKIVQNLDLRWKLWRDANNISIAEADEEEEEVETNEKMDSEGTETANLERTAFSKVKNTEPKYLENKYSGENPLFKGITDYLVDEVNAEEEELLGNDSVNTQTNPSATSFDIEIDNNYNAVLDKLILYLRVVHSFDFYNSIEYQQEDSMPNRCGIMFVRTSLPANAASVSLKTSGDDVTQYTKQFNAKMKPYVEYKERIEPDMAKKLGLKERKEEVEKFIKTNTQELAADRWLCPLSGKKFKGPEFIRKHLFYKHMDKITEVKKEVEYFNNYVCDPKRPQLLEHTTNKPASSQQQGNQYNQQGSQAGYGHQAGANYMHSSPGNMGQGMMGQMPGYGGMQNRQMGGGGYGGMQGGYMQDQMQQSGYGGYGYGGGYQMNRGGRGGYHMNRGGRGGGRDTREMIQYRDLDAPEDN